MTSDELCRLIEQVTTMKAETQTIEIKKAYDGCPQRLYDTLSSFSNQDEGGIIVFGIDESEAFKKVGVYDVHDLQKSVLNQCDQMEPKVRPIFSVYEEEGIYFVSAEIPGIDISERPCYYRGKGRIRGSYVRLGESDQMMTDYEVYSYEAYRKKFENDKRVLPNCNFNLLDKTLLESYLIQLKLDKPNLSQLDDETIYQLFSIKNGEDITLAAELLFGIFPQACVPQLCITAVVVPGNEMGDTTSDNERFIDNQRIEGTISKMLSGAVSFVRKNMKVSTVIDPQTGKRNDREQYPLIAIREIILNALVHRDYSYYTEGTPIQILMFEDRIEITNPGGIYGRLKVGQLGKVRPETRNPVIANAMETLGLIENRYSGIPTIIKEMKKAGLSEPVFRETGDTFTVVLYNEENSLYPASLKKVPLDRSKEAILKFCETPRSRIEIAEFLGLESVSYAMGRYVRPLLQNGQLKMTIPDTPQTTYQKYYSA